MITAAQMRQTRHANALARLVALNDSILQNVAGKPGPLNDFANLYFRDLESGLDLFAQVEAHYTAQGFRVQTRPDGSGLQAHF